MRKTLTSLLICLTSNAYAVDWKLVGKNYNDHALYLDASTLKTVGGYRRGWMMNSYAKSRERRDGIVYSSIVELSEADCKEGKIRTLSSIYKSDEMGRGESLDSFDIENPKWAFAAPGTVGEYQLNVLCKRAMVK